MGHQHRVRLREWFARRKDYGTSAAALELRHPGAVRPLYASAWTAAAWLAAALGHPEAGAVVTGTGTALLARRLAQVTGEAWPRPAGSAAWRLAVAQAAAGRSPRPARWAARSRRTWWPAALPAAIAVRRLRLPLAALVLAPAAAGLAGPQAAARPGAVRGRPAARRRRVQPGGVAGVRGTPDRSAPATGATRA